MGKTKKAGLLARAVTCLAATIAIALGTASPAFATGEPNVDPIVPDAEISVTVPTSIPCIMMADGTVVAPTGLSIVNSGDAVVVDAYTADAMGNTVDFTLDIGGTRALSRTGGKDTAPASGIDFSSGSKVLHLKVSKLDRKTNAALMDKASRGGTDMLKLGFKFSEKALQGDVSISGDTTVGSTLTATAANLQADAKPSYQWYRDGSAISGATSGAYTTVEADAGHEIICKVTDSSGRYSGALTSNAITPVQPEPVAFAIYSDRTLRFYKRGRVPKEGEIFDGRVVYKVFTDFEKQVFASPKDVPWYGFRNSFRGVEIVDTISPICTAYWFYDSQSITTIDVSALDTSQVTDMREMFSDCKSVTTLDLSSFDTSSVTDMRRMFYFCSKLTTLDLSSFDTSQVTDMREIFKGCGVTTLDLSSFDTSQITDMREMFEGCSKLTTLDLSSFDTSSVTDMFGMFNGCNGLMTLDLSSFDTSSVTTMRRMFRICSSLTTLDLSSFDTSKVTDMSDMFDACYSLNNIILFKNTSSVTDIGGMFSQCSSLTTLDLSSFDTSQVTGMNSMFYNCKGLTTLDLSSFDTSNLIYTPKVTFKGCNNLQELTVGDKFSSWVFMSLPAPNAAYIHGADGKWYARSSGIGYTVSELPDNKADTYYASKSLLSVMADI